VDIEMFGNSKLVWLKTFLELPNGIPSHDPSGECSRCWIAEQFQAAFYEWVQAVWEITQGQIVNIDGKCLRGSDDTRLGKRAIIWSVPGRKRIIWFWASAKSMKSRMRSRAIPELLKMLALSGCIVTSTPWARSGDCPKHSGGGCGLSFEREREPGSSI